MKHYKILNIMLHCLIVMLHLNIHAIMSDKLHWYRSWKYDNRNKH